MLRRAFASGFAAPRTRSYPLLPHEWMYHLHDPVPGTADFFSSCSGSRGAVTALPYLQQRCETILNANPWLAARLVSEPRPSFVVPEEPSLADHQSFYAEVGATSLGHDTTSAAFEAARGGLSVSPEMASLFSKKGIDCVDTDEPLFKIRTITAPGGEGFLVTISMSHVFGDGATMYQVHSMLHPDSPVLTLNPERMLGMPAAVRGIEGALPGTTFLPAASHEAPTFDLLPTTMPKWNALLASGVYKPLAEGGTFGPFPPTTGMCNVFLDKAAVARHKQTAAAQGEVAFVSTSDVFTAWLFQASKADLGMMAYNSRPVLGDEAEGRVGNYQVNLTFAPEEFSAASVRRAVNLPGVKGILGGLGGRIAAITSWTQAHKQLDLSALGAVHQLHQPLLPVHLMAASSPPHASAVLYKPIGEHVAASIFSKTFTEDVQGAEILGEPIISSTSYASYDP